MNTFAVLVIVGMVVIMVWVMLINWMDTNDNLKFTFTMNVVKMNQGTDLQKTQNLQNNSKDKCIAFSD